MTAPPRILAIAGSDSSGGAGIQADIKTITMLGGYAMTAITAVTAQNSTGVTMVEALSPEMVGAQIDACLSDIGADSVKIGMTYTKAELARVAPKQHGWVLWKARLGRLWKGYLRFAVALGSLFGAVILTLQYFILVPPFAWAAKRAARRDSQGWVEVGGNAGLDQEY